MDAFTEIPGFGNHNAAPERVDEAHTIYRAIGRNIVLLQQMEQMLKFLSVNANISGPPADMLAEQANRQRQWAKGGLGVLVEDYAKRVLRGTGSDPLDERHAAITSTVCATDADLKTIKSRVRRVVQQRNLLVHELPFPWMPGSAEHFVELHDWLEQLSRELVVEWHQLKHQVRALWHMMELTKAQLESDFFDLDEEGQRAWFAERGIQLEPPPH